VIPEGFNFKDSAVNDAVNIPEGDARRRQALFSALCVLKDDPRR
jgi:hypothetical protein